MKRALGVALFLAGCGHGAYHGYYVASYQSGKFTVLHENMKFTVTCAGGDNLLVYGVHFDACPSAVESVGVELPNALVPEGKWVKEADGFLLLYNQSGETVENLRIVSKQVRY